MADATARHERRPHGAGWQQEPAPGPHRPHISAWRYGRIFVLSELADMELPRGQGVGPTWLVSISRSGRRPSVSDVRKVRRSFGLVDAEVDNHHPGCAVNLFLVVDPAHRVSCECKEDETVVVEADGYEWTTPKDEPCRGCELARMLPGMRTCPVHPDGENSQRAEVGP